LFDESCIINEFNDPFFILRGKGNKKEKKAAFRQCFFKLGEVRSLLPLGSPVLALTATATPNIRKETIEGLALKPDTHQITVSPDRVNIYLYKTKVNKKLDCFKWLIDMLKKIRNNTPRTIVYCKSQKECGKLYRYFKCELGESEYFPEGSKKVSKNSLIGMYHANTLAKHKDIVSDSLYDANGHCRVVFATTALGMGVNLKDIRQVIHYGPPREVDDFVQEMGRAGRDGEPAKSILFYTGGHLRKGSATIRDYADSKLGCLRDILLRDFDENVQRNELQLKHDCCIICHAKCDCTGSGCKVEMPTFVTISPQQTTQKKKRQVKTQQKNELNELLMDFQKQLELRCPAYVMSSQATTGFTNSLIKSVLKNVKHIFSLEDLVERTPVYKKSQAVEILFMIRDVFEDFELEMETLTVDSLDEELNIDFNYEFDNSSDSDSDESVASNTSELSGVMEIQP
jgi:superfamily II DNA helicase RecQ